MNNGLEQVIRCYYNIIKAGKMELKDVPERYRELVEIYWNEVEKAC